MKKLILLASLSLIAVLVLVHAGHSQIQSYYSGDAVSFNNSLYVGSTNTGGLEIFKLENNSLIRLLDVKPRDVYGLSTDFSSLKFSVKNGNLYVYAVDGFTLYKYQLVNDQLKLVKSVKNTYWEWYNRLDKFGGDIVTISQKGVDIWNPDLENIITYSLPSVNQDKNAYTPYNIRGYNNGSILNIQNNFLTVYNRSTQRQVAKVSLDYQTNPGNRQAYQDANGNIFVVDDSYAKKFSSSGQLLGSFKHLDYAGYDVAASGSDNYVYFSNGVGIVKLNATTMKLAGSRWTNRLGGASGWAMGLKVVNLNGDKVVVFNNSNILVLDSNLNKIASFASTKPAQPTSLENLYLNLNQTAAYPSTKVTLSGGGYFPGENMIVNFAGNQTEISADAHGRFQTELTVPNSQSDLVAIKVTGLASNLTYSTSFRIQ